jgi:hypothetical protein
MDKVIETVYSITDLSNPLMNDYNKKTPKIQQKSGIQAFIIL